MPYTDVFTTPMVWLDNATGTGQTVPYYTNTATTTWNTIYTNTIPTTSSWALQYLQVPVYDPLNDPDYPPLDGSTYSIWNRYTGTLNLHLMPDQDNDITTRDPNLNAYLMQWLTEQPDVTPQEYYQLAQGRIVISRERVNAIVALQQERMEREAREATERNQKARAAEIRSRAFLLANLTRAQRKTFEEHQWFIVIGSRSKQRYRIRTSDYVGNVDLLGANDNVVTRYCAHCSGVPLHDHHLAQKLTIQYDEDTFLRVANRR